MEFVPLRDLVLIKPDEAKTTTESGIIIPDEVDREPINIGVVVSVGELVPAPLFPDAKVVFKPYGFDEIVVNDQKLLIGKYELITGILK